MLTVHLLYGSMSRTGIIKGNKPKAIANENFFNSTKLFKISFQFMFLNSVSDVSNKNAISFRHFQQSLKGG